MKNKIRIVLISRHRCMMGKKFGWLIRRLNGNIICDDKRHIKEIIANLKKRNIKYKIVDDEVLEIGEIK